MARNAFYAQSGGVTAVINASAAGVIETARKHKKHIGIYAYRVRYLLEYAQLSPTGPERFEALEQLRALGHGHRIAVAFWDEPMEPGVDTPEDLERVRKKLGASAPL